MTETQKTVLGALPAGSAGGTVADVAREAVLPLAPGVTENIASIASQLEQLRSLTQLQAGSVAENTLAVVQNTATKTGGGAASTAGSVAKSWVSTVMPIVPLIQGLVGLFKHPKAEPPPLQTYALPPSVQFQGAAADGSRGIVASDYGQDGLPRAVTASTPAASVTVNVQAMDSQSFLDHSDEIATAVRQALLKGHGLADVVNDL